MKIAVMGMPGAGRRTVFEALTRGDYSAEKRTGGAVATVKVPDRRVDILAEMYKPKKVTHAQVEYLLPGPGAGKDADGVSLAWTEVRNCDALLAVAANFGPHGQAIEQVAKLESEMLFADFMVVEKRHERLAKEAARGKKVEGRELELLGQAKEKLEAETPLRLVPEIAQAPELRGFGLVSAKPILILANNADEDKQLPQLGGAEKGAQTMVIRGKLEQELAAMPPEEAKEFMEEFDDESSALGRVIEKSYQLLGLISFFTVGEDEVRAWTIKNGTAAADAAEEIHSDIKKGFIRAEVVAYQDLIEAGAMAEAKKQAKFRLEGKEYIVQDGDVISFRFNV